jgi:hypothetical protein
MAMPNKLNLQNNKRNAYFTILGKPRNNITPSPHVEIAGDITIHK